MEPIDPQSQDHSVEIRYRLLDEQGRPRVEPYGMTSLDRAYEVVAIMEQEPNVERLTIFKVIATKDGRRRRKEVFRKTCPRDPTSPQVGHERLRPSGLAR